MLSPNGKAARHNVSKRLGVCHYCGVIGFMTRDHKMPIRYRPQGWRSSHMPQVDACYRCNQHKKDMTYHGFRQWLMSYEGYNWLMQPMILDWRPLSCESGPHPWDGRAVRHYCAARKPCGVLRMQMPVLGDGDSVWGFLPKGILQAA